MLGNPVFGSRTWMCTIAAPALAASIAEEAICSGVTGTAGFLPGVSADPVTAQEIITLRCTAFLPNSSSRGAYNGPRKLDTAQPAGSDHCTLPLIVRCAKPKPVSWNDSDLKNRGDSPLLDTHQHMPGL